MTPVEEFFWEWYEDAASEVWTKDQGRDLFDHLCSAK